MLFNLLIKNLYDTRYYDTIQQLHGRMGKSPGGAFLWATAELKLVRDTLCDRNCVDTTDVTPVLSMKFSITVEICLKLDLNF